MEKTYGVAPPDAVNVCVVPLMTVSRIGEISMADGSTRLPVVSVFKTWNRPKSSFKSAKMIWSTEVPPTPDEFVKIVLAPGCAKYWFPFEGVGSPFLIVQLTPTLLASVSVTTSSAVPEPATYAPVAAQLEVPPPFVVRLNV